MKAHPMSKYSHVVNFVTSKPWAMTREGVESMCGALINHINGDLGAIQAAVQAAEAKRLAADNMRPKANTPGVVAVVNIMGTVMPRANMMSEFSGGVSAEEIGHRLRELDTNPDVKAIVLNVDSPGGSVVGVAELAATIFNLKKYVVAVANGDAASAAYWLASQADELVVTPSGEVGSIGVVMVHMDATLAYEDAGYKPTILRVPEHKYEGSDMEPLAASTHEYWQAQMDQFYDMFTTAVSKGRGVARSVVRGDSWGKGRMLLAKQAVAVGMADRISTLQEVIEGLGGNLTMQPRRQARAEAMQAAEAEIEAEEKRTKLAIERQRLQVASA